MCSRRPIVETEATRIAPEDEDTNLATVRSPLHCNSVMHRTAVAT